MPVRKMINRQVICDAALRIIAMSGVDSLSMRTLGKALGIKAPSLYAHVKNRDEVIALVQGWGLLDFGNGFAAAGPKVRDKIVFYRQWAMANPKLYPVVFQQKLHRYLLPQGLEEEVLALVIVAAGGSHVQARAIWAQLHGLIDLELQDRFPADADINATWEQAIASIVAAQKLTRARK